MTVSDFEFGYYSHVKYDTKVKKSRQYYNAPDSAVGCDDWLEGEETEL